MGKEQRKQQDKRQKDNRQRRKKKFSWPMVVLGGILLVAVALFLANRHGIGKHGSGPPKIAVDQQRIDYGYVRYGTNETFDIEVTNIGGTVLRFNEKPYIKVLEGC
jgi:hypothetical protein